MADQEVDYALYALCRTDLASMTRGMSVAQGMHAQAHAHHAILTTSGFGDDWAVAYTAWCRTTKQGFGTALSMDGGNIAAIRTLVDAASGYGFPAAVTHDPEYPVRDGDVVHLVPLDTCAWIFGQRHLLAPILKDLDLLGD
jgi:hypothetical protein